MNSHVSAIIAHATDPTQYDAPDIAWTPEESPNSPLRAFIWEYLQPFAKHWKGKDMLDVGTGNGWLLEEARRIGAHMVIGIDPSRKNIDVGRELFPNIMLERVSLGDYDTRRTFDIITCVLALSHMPDIDVALRKIASLLTDGGEFDAVILDYETYHIPRHCLHVDMTEIDDDSYAVTMHSGKKSLVDIVSRTEHIIDHARLAGFDHLASIPMLPTARLLASWNEFYEFSGEPIYRLLRFNKSA